MSLWRQSLTRRLLLNIITVRSIWSNAGSPKDQTRVSCAESIAGTAEHRGIRAGIHQGRRRRQGADKRSIPHGSSAAQGPPAREGLRGVERGGLFLARSAEIPLSASAGRQDTAVAFSAGPASRSHTTAAWVGVLGCLRPMVAHSQPAKSTSSNSAVLMKL
ncbi:hypothetical protein FKM82_004861 [Ascaphus truei]